VAKPDLGTKRICPACGAKYYDLRRDPIVCPSCGTVFELAAHQKAPVRAIEPKVEKVVETEAVVVREENVVSLEDAEVVEEDVGPDADEDAVIPGADIDVDEEVETEDADVFLEEDEEEGADVAELLDVDAKNEEER